MINNSDSPYHQKISIIDKIKKEKTQLIQFLVILDMEFLTQAVFKN